MKFAETSKINWPEPKREAPKISETLPSSEDKEFWADAEIWHAPFESPRQRYSEHRFMQKGREIICLGCPYTHSVPIDTSKFTVRDGRIVPIA